MRRDPTKPDHQSQNSNGDREGWQVAENSRRRSLTADPIDPPAARKTAASDRHDLGFMA
jgi:hypothetical protein